MFCWPQCASTELQKHRTQSSYDKTKAANEAADDVIMYKRAVEDSIHGNDQ